MMWNFLQKQILGMQWLNELIGSLLTSAGVDISGRGGGSQVLSLGAAQGGFVELALPEPGHYPFVTHAMADAEKGAHGVLKVR